MARESCRSMRQGFGKKKKKTHTCLRLVTDSSHTPVWKDPPMAVNHSMEGQTRLNEAFSWTQPTA